MQHIFLLEFYVILNLLVLDVAIVNEKVSQLEEFGRRLSFRVDGYHGSEGVVPPPPGNQIMVATIEKVPVLHLSSSGGQG